MVDARGKGFRSLITFTLEMAMIIIGGYAVATTRPMAWVITRLAQIPRGPRSAVVWVAAVAMLASHLNWAFSPVFACRAVCCPARLARLWPSSVSGRGCSRVRGRVCSR
jgi:short subunit fatty acids transporter